jgi:hypothetical protein
MRNSRNTKIFCYLKAMDISPVRIEFFVDSFEQNKDSVLPVLNLIDYLILAQGQPKNPQARPIAVAEAYARETLRLMDFQRIMHDSGLHPTINQERFAW